MSFVETIRSIGRLSIILMWITTRFCWVRAIGQSDWVIKSWEMCKGSLFVSLLEIIQTMFMATTRLMRHTRIIILWPLSALVIWSFIKFYSNSYPNYRVFLKTRHFISIINKHFNLNRNFMKLRLQLKFLLKK